MKNNEMVVLYDGGCPMCSREILHYKNVGKNLPIQWLDVTSPEVNITEFGLTRKEALELFHVVDTSGQMHTGAEAFINLWSELPGYRWLSRLATSLKLKPVLNSLYRRFAKWHFSRRCPSGECAIPD